MKEQLQILRKNKGLTQEDAADIFGVKLSTYQKYERDAISPPYNTLIKIADFYGVTTDYLLGREPAPNPFADLGLSESGEQEMLKQYMKFKPEVRTVLMNVLIKLGDSAKPDEAPEIVEETSSGSQLERREVTDAEAEETAV